MKVMESSKCISPHLLCQWIDWKNVLGSERRSELDPSYQLWRGFCHQALGVYELISADPFLSLYIICPANAIQGSKKKNQQKVTFRVHLQCSVSRANISLSRDT